MRKSFKRIISILCTFILLAQIVYMGKSLISFAANDDALNEWYFLKGEESFSAEANGKLIFEKKNCNVKVADGVRAADLMLSFTVTVEDENALEAIKTMCVQLAQESDGKQEIRRAMSDYSFSLGENKVEISLLASDFAYNYGSSDKGFTLDEAINYFRIYTNASAKGGSAKIKDVKLYDTRTAGLDFGKNDTYLSLSKPLTEAPQTIEASVKGEAAVGGEWTVFSAENPQNLNPKSVVTGVISEHTDTPPAGEKYLEFTTGQGSTLTFVSEDEIDASEYGWDNLKLSYWIYDEDANNTTIFNKGGYRILDGDKAGYQFATGVVTAVSGKWQKMEYSLAGEQGTALGKNQSVDAGNRYELADAAINSLKYISIFNARYEKDGVVQSGNTVRIAGLTLSTTDGTKQWKFDFSNAKNFAPTGVFKNGTIGAVESEPSVGTGYVDVKASIPSNSSSMSAAYTLSEAINISKYAKDELALEFWIYSDMAGQPFKEGRLRLANGTTALDTDANFDYSARSLTVKKGWNKIVLSLNDFILFSSQVSSAPEFVWDNGIRTFKLHGIKLNDGMADANIKVSDVKLVSLFGKTEWELGNIADYSVSDTTNVFTNATVVKTDFTTADTEIGQDYLKFKSPADTNTTSKITWKFAPVNLSKIYAEGNIKLEYWLYAEEDTAQVFSGGAIRIVDSVDSGFHIGLDRKETKNLKKGWNKITISTPLSDWIKLGKYGSTSDLSAFESATERISKVFITGAKFKNANKVYGIRGLKIYVDSGSYATAVTSSDFDNTAVNDDMAVFTNTASANETDYYGLFITKEGYPSLVYGNKRFTLNQSVMNGQWNDIAVVRDKDMYINFYINGQFVAKSTVKADADLSKFSVCHTVGANTAGEQLFGGRIADIRLWKDIRTENEINENRMEKKTSLTKNGLSPTTRGLLNNWVLFGDIQEIRTTMPDNSNNKNNLVFKGSRALDWVEYEIPDEIGDDYWTMVFVPDLQNITDNAGGKFAYSETWRKMADWIVANKEKENIKHVAVAGDLTWSNNDTQYTNSMRGFSVLNGNVSWNSVIGNHDYNWKVTYRDSSMYQKYFGVEQVNENTFSTLTGYFSDPAGKSTTENSYYCFTVNGVKWMVMQLEMHPRQSVLNWAKEIFNKYSSYNVILTTHSYLDGYGNYTVNKNMNYINEDTDNAAGGYIGDSTEGIWTALKSCTNIKMILCGHSVNNTGSVVQKTEYNSENQAVPALMINAQDVDAGHGQRDGSTYYTNRPLGMLGIFRFSKDGSKVALQYYSPTEDGTFNPEFNGVRDSNSHIYTFNVVSCNHKTPDGADAKILVNQNSASDYIDGYTGDTYCTECDTVIQWGKVIPKLKLNEVLLLGGDLSGLSGNMSKNDFEIYTTTAADTPDIGLKCISFTSGDNLISIKNNVDIDISKYSLEKLAVKFWVKSSKAGSLFTSGRIRLSNGTSGSDSDANLDVPASSIKVKEGWNEIVIPLSNFKQSNTWVASAAAFDPSKGIKTFKFHGCKNSANVDLIISGVWLVEIQNSNAVIEDDSSVNNSGVIHNSSNIHLKDGNSILSYVPKEEFATDNSEQPDKTEPNSSENKDKFTETEPVSNGVNIVLIVIISIAVLIVLAAVIISLKFKVFK